MSQTQDLKVILIINIIDDEVTNHLEVDLIIKPLEVVFWIYESEYVEEYDEVIASFTILDS